MKLGSAYNFPWENKTTLRKSNKIRVRLKIFLGKSSWENPRFLGKVLLWHARAAMAGACRAS